MLSCWSTRATPTGFDKVSLMSFTLSVPQYSFTNRICGREFLAMFLFIFPLFHMECNTARSFLEGCANCRWTWAIVCGGGMRNNPGQYIPVISNWAVIVSVVVPWLTNSPFTLDTVLFSNKFEMVMRLFWTHKKMTNHVYFTYFIS